MDCQSSWGLTSKTNSSEAGWVSQAFRSISSSSWPGLQPAYPTNILVFFAGDNDSPMSTKLSSEWPRLRLGNTLASRIKASVCRKLRAVGWTGPPRYRGEDFKISGRSATIKSPTFRPVLRLSTRPNAPSASCWQISTTVRWKKEPRNWPLSSSNWPFMIFFGSAIGNTMLHFRPAGNRDYFAPIVIYGIRRTNSCSWPVPTILTRTRSLRISRHRNATLVGPPKLGLKPIPPLWP